MSTDRVSVSVNVEPRLLAKIVKAVNFAAAMGGNGQPFEGVEYDAQGMPVYDRSGPLTPDEIIDEAAEWLYRTAAEEADERMRERNEQARR